MSLKANIPTKDMKNKTIAEIGYLIYLSSMIKINVNCKREIKSNVAKEKVAF